MNERDGSVIRIGVTGPRKLGDKVAFVAAVRTVLGRIRRWLPKGKDSNPFFEVVSPLAEGADRLIAGEILKEPDARLVVPLPFQTEEYKKDFRSPGSKDEFEFFLQKAAKVEVLPPTGTRSIGYEQAGRYVVDHSDVLIAIWDGNSSKGRGGTADVVRLARRRKLPLYWIHTSDPGRITEEPGTGFGSN